MKNVMHGFIGLVTLAIISSCEQIQVVEKEMLIAPTLYTAPKTARMTTQLTPINPCTENCLQYRYTPSESWMYLYKDQIKGFTFEAGFNYKLRVKIESSSNSTGSYSLLQTLEKTKAQ
jgi:hypothetical protein